MPKIRRRDVAPAYLIRQAHVSAQGAHTKLSDKDQRLVSLEQDKPLQDAKLAALESDKAVKDTKVAALEADKVDKDTRVTALEASSVGIVDGGRANLQHVEATAINGGNASTT